MRPRVFPAEDAEEATKAFWDMAASMRPRVFPAEDLSSPAGSIRDTARFNEAAGIPRGRLPTMGQTGNRGRVLQ